MLAPGVQPVSAAPDPRTSSHTSPAPITPQMDTMAITDSVQRAQVDLRPDEHPSEHAGGQVPPHANRSTQADGSTDDDEANEDCDNYQSTPAVKAMQQASDPFYDETADDDDATWADRQRGGRVSDAVLSCPGCFTTLCIDCQRHEKHHQQYRAMFVMNCIVEEEGEEEGHGGGRGRGGRGRGGGFDPARATAATESTGGRRPKLARGSSLYRRVCCSVCDTEVGALEVEEELYHFYHIFPSNA